MNKHIHYRGKQNKREVSSNINRFRRKCKKGILIDAVFCK